MTYDYAALISEVNTYINTNGVGAITGAVGNMVFKDVIDSTYNRITDAAIVGFQQHEAGGIYRAGQQIQRNGYVAVARRTGVTGAYSAPTDWIGQTAGNVIGIQLFQYPLYDGTSYLADVYVQYEYGLFKSNQAVPAGVTPTNATYWDFIYVNNNKFGNAWQAGSYSSADVVMGADGLLYKADVTVIGAPEWISDDFAVDLAAGKWVKVGGDANVNPTDTYLPYNNGGSFADTWLKHVAGYIGVEDGKYISSLDGQIQLDFGSGSYFSLATDGGAFNTPHFYGSATEMSMYGLNGGGYSLNTNIATIEHSVFVKIDVNGDTEFEFDPTYFWLHTSYGSAEIYAEATEMKFGHDTLMTFNAPVYHFQQATASYIPFIDASNHMVASFFSQDATNVFVDDNILLSSLDGNNTMQFGGAGNFVFNASAANLEFNALGDFEVVAQDNVKLHGVQGFNLTSPLYNMNSTFSTMEVVGYIRGIASDAVNFEAEYLFNSTFSKMGWNSLVGPESGNLIIDAAQSWLGHSTKILFDAPEYNFSQIAAWSFVWIDSNNNLTASATLLQYVDQTAIQSPDASSQITVTDGAPGINFTGNKTTFNVSEINIPYLTAGTIPYVDSSNNVVDSWLYQDTDYIYIQDLKEFSSPDGLSRYRLPDGAGSSNNAGLVVTNGSTYFSSQTAGQNNSAISWSNMGGGVSGNFNVTVTSSAIVHSVLIKTLAPQLELDTTATGASNVVSIGTTNADVVNIGRSGGTVNILGTALYEYAANQYVLDKLITLNYNGAAASGIGVGFEIEENAVITGYLKTNATRDGYSFLTPAIAYKADISLASLTADRVYTLPDATGTIALTGSTLATFAPTTSAELAGVITDETGYSGGALLVFNTSPTFVTDITTPLIIGGTGTTQTLTYRTTTGIGATGADHIWQVGNNGATEAMRILNAGNVIIGASSIVSAEKFSVQNSANSATIARIKNATSGTAATAGYIANNSGDATINMIAYSATFTTSGFQIPNSGGIFTSSGMTNGLYISTLGTNPISFYTNNTKRGMWLSTGEFVVGTPNTLIATEVFSVQENANSITQGIISNTTSGTAARAVLSALVSGIVGCSIQAISAAYTTSNILVANTSVLNSSQTGGLNIGTTANAQMSGWTNNIMRYTVTSDGEFVIGAATPIAAEIFSVQQNQNALTRGLISNTTSGTAARTIWQVFTNGSLGISMVANSTAYTTSGMLVANTSALLSTQTGGLNIGTAAGGNQVSTWTNNLRRMMVLSTGEVIFGDASAVIAGEYVSFQYSANVNVSIRAKNAISGTAASSSFIVSNSSNAAASFVAYSAGFTSSGLSIASAGALFSGSGLTGGLQVGTVGTNPLGLWTNSIQRLNITSGGLATWTTTYHVLSAGTAVAATAPLKFIAGTNMTAAEAGAVEFDGTHLFYTNSTPTRKRLSFEIEATISASDIDWGITHHYKTLSANTTFTFSNAIGARTIIVAITNTASNYTVTWPAVQWSGGVAPVQTVGAKTDVYTFTQVNGVIYGNVIQNIS